MTDPRQRWLMIMATDPARWCARPSGGWWCTRHPHDEGTCNLRPRRWNISKSARVYRRTLRRQHA